MKFVLFNAAHGTKLAVHPDHVCDVWEADGKTRLRTLADAGAINGDVICWQIEMPLADVIAALEAASIA